MKIVNNVADLTLLLEHQYRVFTIIHEADAQIDRMAERMEQVVQAVVPAMRHPLGDAQLRHLDAGQDQID